MSAEVETVESAKSEQMCPKLHADCELIAFLEMKNLGQKDYSQLHDNNVGNDSVFALDWVAAPSSLQKNDENAQSIRPFISDQEDFHSIIHWFRSSDFWDPINVRWLPFNRLVEQSIRISVHRRRARHENLHPCIQIIELNFHRVFRVRFREFRIFGSIPTKIAVNKQLHLNFEQANWSIMNFAGHRNFTIDSPGGFWVSFFVRLLQNRWTFMQLNAFISIQHAKLHSIDHFLNATFAVLITDACSVPITRAPALQPVAHFLLRREQNNNFIRDILTWTHRLS